jgi:uncharacterized iron-regulated membrane protein
MNPIRRVLFWAHLVLGLLAGGLILITVITGASMAFRRQWIAWDESPSPLSAPGTADAKPQPLEVLLAKVAEAHPDVRPQSVTVSADPARPWVVELERMRRIAVDPYRGDLMELPAGRVRAARRWMENCHRWLGAEDPPRQEGAPGGGSREGGPDRPAGWTPRRITSTVMGASASVFLVLSLSGLFLWFPRRLTWTAFRAVLWPRWGLGSKARDWNWHNAVGVWCAVPIAIMALTGMSIAFRGFGDVLYGGAAPRREGPGGDVVAPPSEGARPLAPQGLLESVQRAAPGWREITLRLGGGRERGERGGRGGREGGPGREREAERGPGGGGGSGGGGAGRAVVANVRSSGSALLPDDTWRLDPYTGQRLAETPATGGWRSRLRAMNQRIHTGEAGGVLGQAAAFLGCVGGVVLVWTGFALALRRFLPRLFRKSAEPAS